MANSDSNSNLGVFSYVQMLLIALVLSSPVLSNGDTMPSNDVASSICPKTKNVSLCWSLLKPAGTTDGIKLANYTLNIAHTSVDKCFSLTRRLEAVETVNPQLKKRYSQCLRELQFVVWDIEQGKEALTNGGYIRLEHGTIAAMLSADNCLKTFKHPPSEPSKLPEKVKNLGDICDIAAWVSSILAGNDY